MKIFYLWPAVITIIFSAMSEYNAGTFSSIWDYIVSDLDGETMGTITKSEIKIVGRWGVGAYDIRYAYTVNNIEFTGSQVNYDSKTSRYEEMVQKYPLGSKVIVYYDSSKPKYSTLEKVVLGVGAYFQIIAVVSCYIFFAWLSSNLDSGKKRIKHNKNIAK